MALTRSGNPVARISASGGPAALAALLAALTLAAYVPALFGGFVWDDDYNVTANDNLTRPDGLRRIWLEPRSEQQHYPLTHTSFWVEYRLWGLRPSGYHLVNVLLHAASSVLLWRILCRLGARGAWLAAAIFALHPVQVESVAWITERKNTLSGVLYFASALAFLLWVVRRRDPGRGRGGAGLASLSLALFIGALAAKSVTATLPVALALVVAWRVGRLRRAELALLGGMVAAGLAAGLHTLALELHHVGARGPEFALGPAERVLVAGRALAFYLGQLAWPSGLAFSYARWSIDAGSLWAYAYPVGAVAVLAVLWLGRRRIGTAPIAALGYFALTLAPALGLVNVFYMRYAFVADHFQYLACAGPIALAAAGLAWPRAPRSVMRFTGAALLLVLGALTWNQAGAYRDEETLWRRSLAAEPDSFLAHYNLGELLAREDRVDEALEHYREALRIQPGWVDARVNMGALLGARGQIGEAIGCFERAIQDSPGHAMAHFNLGLAMELSERPERALAEYREALRLDPDLQKARRNLTLLLHTLGRDGEAPDPAPR